MAYRTLAILALASGSWLTWGCGGGSPNVDLDGSTDGDTDADGGPEGFTCTAVEPTAASTLVDAEFTVIGSGFQAGMLVLVTETTSSEEVNLGAATVYSPSGATAAAAAGQVPAGVYAVTLVSPDAEVVTCTDTISWLEELPPTVTAVDPASAWTGLTTDDTVSDLQVLVQGTGFESTPMVTWVDVDDPGVRYPAGVVLFTDEQNLESICPSETEAMPAGLYWVEVTNPDGLGAFWMIGEERGLFEIVDIPPPMIADIDPFRSPAADTPTVTITGSYFQDGATVELLVMAGDPLPMATAFVDPQTLTAPFSVAQGIYPVRVTNPDGQYDIYYSYEATPSSDAHLESFEQIEPELATARWRHGSCAGFDSFGGTYIYTAGGLDADGNVLGDVEVLPISGFGEPGATWAAVQWNGASDPRAPNELATPRHGLALVRAGSWIYAVGGTAENTNVIGADAAALATVERAPILGLETRPVIDSISAGGAGELDVGTWYYQVSAVGAWGESIASGRKMVSGGGGTVQLDWVGVPGATSYNIYRNVDATGNGGDTRLLATGVTDSEFTDDGGDTPAADGVAPLPFGSLGKWQEVAEEMQFPREGVDAVVATIPSGEEDVPDRTFLFAVGGRPDATGGGYLASGERAEVLADGDLGPFAPLSYDLDTPRAFYVLITNQGQDESGFVPDDPEVPISKSPWTEPIYLFAVQGDDAHDGTANDGLIDFEACEIVTSDGDNGEWTTQHETVSPGQPAHGLGAALFFDHLFAFKGVSAEDLGDDPVVGGSAATRLEFFEDAADPAYILDDRQSTATAFTTDRAYYKMVRVNGYLWAIGGNDGSGPIATIDRTLQ